jgi:prepilin-type N-terminal cleavage/methylation domain-containing protein
MKRKNGFTLVEAIVTSVLMAVLAVVAFASYRGYVNSARVDSARSACELVGAAIIQTHNRGLNIAANDWSAIGISNPADDHWTYSFAALSASAAMGDDYGISAASGTLGTWTLKPKQNGSGRWTQQSE